MRDIAMKVKELKKLIGEATENDLNKKVVLSCSDIESENKQRYERKVRSAGWASDGFYLLSD